MKVSLALWPRQAQPRMGRWSIAHGDGSAEPWVRRPSTPQSPKWDGRAWTPALRSAAPCGAGQLLGLAPPGSQSLAGGYIPSPHAGLSMGMTDQERLQMCYCTHGVRPRILGMFDEAGKDYPLPAPPASERGPKPLLSSRERKGEGLGPFPTPRGRLGGWSRPRAAPCGTQKEGCGFRHCSILAGFTAWPNLQIPGRKTRTKAK